MMKAKVKSLDVHLGQIKTYSDCRLLGQSYVPHTVTAPSPCRLCTEPAQAHTVSMQNLGRLHGNCTSISLFLNDLSTASVRLRLACHQVSIQKITLSLYTM